MQTALKYNSLKWKRAIRQEVVGQILLKIYCSGAIDESMTQFSSSVFVRGISHMFKNLRKS